MMLAALGAACTGSSSPTTAPAATAPATTTTGTTPSPTTTAAAVDPGQYPGRIVILDEAGNVVTVRPDGSDEVALTAEAGSQLQFSQPTWSPDGSRVAWTQVDGRDGSARASIVTTRFDGSERAEAETPFPVFYMLWDPASARIAYLHSGVPVLEMGILDVAAGATRAATVDTGQPYYFSWAPDGAALLTHVGPFDAADPDAGASRLDVIDLDGAGTPVGPVPGAFQAPVWTPAGRMVYATVAGDEQRLVEAGADGSDVNALVSFDGFIWFVASPDGAEIAFQVRAAGAPPAVTAAFQPAPPPAPREALATVDVATGQVTTLSVDAAVAFFYSPTGTLASLHADGDRWFRWRVWGDAPFTGPRFRPTLTLLRDYLPFFDQYAQSMSPWSPDGAALVFVGQLEGQGPGVWVLPAVAGAAPVEIGQGRFASWSPG